ncbi:MAG: hypothetical protein M3247_09100 [Thermoproteota archaeon]|nr:hypothetical protein [Thermoproteota archaeon]
MLIRISKEEKKQKSLTQTTKRNRRKIRLNPDIQKLHYGRYGKGADKVSKHRMKLSKLLRPTWYFVGNDKWRCQSCWFILYHKRRYAEYNKETGIRRAS